MMIGIADSTHYGCGTDQVRNLVPLLLELGERRRRGRPKRRKLPTSVFMGYCVACDKPRLFAYRPREQGVLPLEGGAPASSEPERPAPVDEH